MTGVIDTTCFRPPFHNQDKKPHASIYFGVSTQESGVADADRVVDIDVAYAATDSIFELQYGNFGFSRYFFENSKKVPQSCSLFALKLALTIQNWLSFSLKEEPKCIPLGRSSGIFQKMLEIFPN